MYNDFTKNFTLNNTAKITFSKPDKYEFKKTTIKPLMIKNERAWQVEQFDGTKAFHTTVYENKLLDYIKHNVINNYKEINIVQTEKSIVLKKNKKGNVFEKITKNKNPIKINLNHNVKKQYILAEGMKIEPLVDLGVFNEEYKVIKSKYNKYRQINKFVEIIDNALRKEDINKFTILDFGCGKSYLTFILYYYFTVIKKAEVKIIGYDLKQDVVDDCNKIAKKYKFKNLSFICGDVANADTGSAYIDMMISLHACDTATDYALHKAIKQNIKYVFSAPCCQQEVNAQIKTDDNINVMLQHGLIKERFSALLTDAIRCEVLKLQGYDVGVIEFVDFDNSPKNLMIRAIKNPKLKTQIVSKQLQELTKNLNITPKIIELIKK